MIEKNELTELNIDLHIHSNHSSDATSTVDEMCREAVRKGLRIVCFTEHVDMNPKDDGYEYFRYDKYSADIELAREKYHRDLLILMGIEFSEPHIYPREFETITKADFDFVLGSVHWLEEFGQYWHDGNNLQPTYPAKRLFEVYYNEVLNAIRFGGFDSLAHIDFPKRYLLNKYEPADVLDEVMVELVKRGIALELNSHPIRKGYPEINPSDSICAIYSKHGGRKVTTGSDAHRYENVGQDFDSLSRVIQLYNFKPVYFMKRQETERSGVKHNLGQ